jgi:hypothetical protein
VLDDQQVSFSGPSELIELLAQSKEAHRCYSSRWIEFAFGRPLSTEDVQTWNALGAASLPVADIVAELVTSPQFLSLSPSVGEGAEVSP